MIDRHLTPKEWEVIHLMMCGYKIGAISAKMGIARRTYKKHIDRISMKLGIDRKKFHVRVRIVYLIAKQRGTIQPPDCFEKMGATQMPRGSRPVIYPADRELVMDYFEG